MVTIHEREVTRTETMDHLERTERLEEKWDTMREYEEMGEGENE